MNEKDKKQTIDRYNKKFERFGKSVESLGWSGGEKSQNQRFKTICEIGIQDGHSILDVGCGFGTFFQFLKNKYTNLIYTGVDINQKFIDIAQADFQDAVFLKKDILTDKIDFKYDWVVASGIFNRILEYENTIMYLDKMIKKMYSLSTMGIAIDFMHEFVDYRSEGSFHVKMNDIFSIIRPMTTVINLRMDYLNYECMFHIYKPKIL